jgi:hypothetical protein
MCAQSYGMNRISQVIDEYEIGYAETENAGQAA